jgi:methylglutamate dehydrogenase subunit D
MAEPVTALAALPAPGGGAGATLSEVAGGTVLRIQAWPDTIDAVRRVATDVLDMEAPPLGHAATKGGVSLIAAAPGTFFVAGLASEVAWLVQEALPPTTAAVTDLSHGRAILGLEGERAAEVLQKCVILDLASFPPGRAAQTAIHHVDVLVHHVAETRFELWVLRSFALSIAEWLIDAGLEEGVGFRR